MPPTCKKGIKNLLINQCLQAISWTKVGTWQGFTRMHQAQLWELLQHRKSDSKVTTSIKARRFCCRQRTFCCRYRSEEGQQQQGLPRCPAGSQNPTPSLQPQQNSSAHSKHQLSRAAHAGITPLPAVWAKSYKNS